MSATQEAHPCSVRGHSSHLRPSSSRSRGPRPGLGGWHWVWSQLCSTLLGDPGQALPHRPPIPTRWLVTYALHSSQNPGICHFTSSC